MYIVLILCTTFVSQTTSENGFTPPPMSTPPMPQPPLSWDTRDIKYFFGRISSNCNLSQVCFCDPNHVIRKNDAENIVHILNTTEQYTNNISRGLSIGVAVIKKINVISEDGSSVYMKPYNNLVRAEWKELHSQCDVAILLFVSCADFSMYESFDLHTSSIVDSRCNHLLNVSNPSVFEEDSDCFKDIIEPRIMIYQQILDGTHPCYYDDVTSYVNWIALGIISLLFTLIIMCVLYHKRKPNDVNLDEQIELRYKHSK